MPLPTRPEACSGRVGAPAVANDPLRDSSDGSGAGDPAWRIAYDPGPPSSGIVHLSNRPSSSVER